MKILILTDAVEPFSMGGAERSVYDLGQSYGEGGHQTVVITVVHKKDQANFFKKDNYQINSLYFPYYHERWRGLFGLWNPFLLEKLRQILEEEKPDVVHVHNIHKYFSYASLMLIKKMGIPSVLTIHDCMPVCYKKFTCFIDNCVNGICSYKANPWQCLACQRGRFLLNPFRNFFIRYLINRCLDKVIAVSEELQKLLDANGIRCNSFIHHGLDIDKFKITETQVVDFKNEYKLNNKKVIFFGGRVSAAKGIDYLLRAVNLIYKKRQDVILLIVGEKNHHIADLSYNWALNTGWLGQEKLSAAYACSDVVVYPSVCFDTFGLINLEAMAMKKPVVASCFGGSQEIIVDGTTGFIVNPLDINAMAEKIEYLLNNPDRAREMGVAGYQRFLSRFTLDKEVSAYLKIFSDLCLVCPKK